MERQSSKRDVGPRVHSWNARRSYPMTPYRICASVPPEPPDHDVLRYAARVRDERRRLALVALLLTVSALVVLLAMGRPESHCERIVENECRAPVHELPMLPRKPRLSAPQLARVAFVRSVAQDIAALEPRYPELADFDVGRDFYAADLEISYRFLRTLSPIPGRKKYAHAREPEGLSLSVRLVEYSSGWRLDAHVGGYPRKLPPGGRPFVPPLEGPGGPTVYGAIGAIVERHEREAGGLRS